MRFTCRLTALAQSIIAIGIIAWLHSLAAAACDIHLGVRVAIVGAVLLALLFLLAALNFFTNGRWVSELATALLIGIAVLVGLDQINEAVDRQVGNWAILGGLALLNAAIWLSKTETPEGPSSGVAPATKTSSE